jgi:hypothetical protein
MPNDIYEINGRIKNHIARENIALSPVGTILVNYFSLFFKDLYDFTEKYDHHPHIEELKNIINKNEKMPLLIIQSSIPFMQEEEEHE